MLDSAGKLVVAELALYIILFFPAVYTLFKHRLQGALGWFFVVSFCGLRLIGSALLITNENNGSSPETADTINGVGLSPLILCFIGILHESNHYVTDSRHKSFLLRFWPSIALHFIVSGGLGLVVVGLLSNSPNGKDLAQAGYIVLLIVGLIVAGLVALSWRCAHNNAASKRLLIAVTLGLPFLIIRILYSTISASDTAISPFTGPIGYRIGLAVIMELIIVIILNIFGILFRNICYEQGMRPTIEVQDESAELHQPRKSGFPRGSMYSCRTERLERAYAATTPLHCTPAT